MQRNFHMRHSALVLTALLALGLAAPMASFSAKKARHPRETGQIACTIVGCHRIPPECHPEMGYDINGIPIGFDIVVCPEPRRR
jgi:hypothetical protein